MTPAEKRALRKWVASGHSAAESPGSKYICDIGMDFLDVYRADHEIAAAIRGMTRAEKTAYIKEYTGYGSPRIGDLCCTGFCSLFGRESLLTLSKLDAAIDVRKSSRLEHIQIIDFQQLQISLYPLQMIIQ